MSGLGAKLMVLGWWRTAVIVSAVAVVAVGAVLVRDVMRIDPTSGGYSAPYDDYSGEPIDWMAQVQTDQGFRDDGGILLNAGLDCTTGQISIHVGPVAFDYRKLSDRAIAVHKPHVACIERGFEPQWDYPAADIARQDEDDIRG